MKRSVKLKVEKMGFWKIFCPTCPLLPHLKALEQEPKACVQGLSTNMQGAVPLGGCKHKVGEIGGEGKKLEVSCNYGEPPTPARDSGSQQEGGTRE